MHFRLDSSLLELDFQKISEHSALENLLNADFSGHHIVSADRNTFLKLHSVIGLSRRSYSVLIRKYNGFASHGSAYRRLPHVVSVEANLEKIEKASDKLWKVPLNTFAHFIPTSALLMAENLTDCRAYRVAAYHYIHYRELNSLTISARIDGAGGATTPDRFNEIARTKSDICVCVTDSDRMSPGCNPATTSAKCTAIDRDSDWLIKHVTTETRELENTIPSIAYELCGIAQVEAAVSVLKKAIEAVDPALWAYADLKNGVSIKWLLKRNSRSAAYVFWSDALSGVELKEKPKVCIETSVCQRDAERNDELCPECVVLPAVSKRMAEHVVEWFTSDPHRNRFDALGGCAMDDWLRIGLSVFEVCCASTRQRI